MRIWYILIQRRVLWMVRDDYNVARQVNASKAMKKMVKDAEEYTIIAIHNHPGSSVPSLSDIIVAQERKV